MTSEALTELLATLVDIPSETGHEAEIAAWTAARLERAGKGEVIRSGHSVIWRGPRAERPLLVLAGHLDTVPAQGNGAARVVDGNLHGLGSTDMKGGDAVMLGLHDSLDPAAARYDVALVFYDAEEGPAVNNGLARVLAEQTWLTGARLAILLEPTDLQVELGCNGILNGEVRVSGKAAHSARPWSGINAVERAAPWLAEIVRFPVTPVTIGGAEFRETLQITTLRAGRTRNVVPDELVANLNYRFPPDRTMAEAEARLRTLVPESFVLEIVDGAPPGKVCADEPAVHEFVERFGVAVTGKQGWTDVARFTAAGIPAFNYGPGIPELCHQAEEYCPIANLEVAWRRLHEFVSGPA